MSRSTDPAWMERDRDLRAAAAIERGIVDGALRCESAITTEAANCGTARERGSVGEFASAFRDLLANCRRLRQVRARIAPTLRLPRGHVCSRCGQPGHNTRTCRAPSRVSGG